MQFAEMASRGDDVSAYFTNKFSAVRPAQVVNIDLTRGMLRELDARAARLNESPSGDQDIVAASVGPRIGVPAKFQEEGVLSYD
jgi:hypothetical protein